MVGMDEWAYGGCKWLGRGCLPVCVWIRRNDRMHGGSRIGRGGVCAWVCV